MDPDQSSRGGQFDPFTFPGALAGLVVLALIVAGLFAAWWALIWCSGLIWALLRSVAWLATGRHGRFPLREFIHLGP